MDVRLEIRRNADGALATDKWESWDFNAYWWKDGNAACDCNRELFFLRANNEDDSVDTECGEGRYSVRLCDAKTGALLYDEFEPVKGGE